MKSELENIASSYAAKCHRDTNHMYGSFPYTAHLHSVRSVAYRYRHHIPEGKQSVVFSGAWCHDIIEDTRQTYNDVVTAVGTEVAELVYALTNEKGKNRAERANQKYYDGIKATPMATFLKLCDRIANIKAATKHTRMLEVYKKEQAKFRAALHTPEYDDMWQYMERLLGMNATLTPAEAAKGRSSHYYSLSPQEQWDEDKRLGILDWDGK